MNQANTQGEAKKNLNFSGEKIIFSQLISQMLAILPERSQKIIARRYGLAGKKSETLEKIGKDYNITRERVRQIVSDALRNVTKIREGEYFKKAENRLIFTIEKNNGIIKEDGVASLLNLNENEEINAVKFLADCSSKIEIIDDKEVIDRSWVLSEDVLQKVRKINDRAQEVLLNKKKVLTDKEISEELASHFPEFDPEEIISYLEVLSNVKRNRFGKWGKANWPEINPKGTREKIYLVLKETGKPMHFTQIATFIDEYQLSSKKAHPQTVHNELIKDNRFVLIGRGIYALSEWGYSEGTIKEVLRDILQKSRKPLNREEILSKVLELRRVKKSTILINLNNEEIFERRNNLYSLKR